MQKALAEDNFPVKGSVRGYYSLYSVMNLRKNYIVQHFVVYLCEREFICAKGSTGVSCTVQRALGDANFNIMKVSGILGFITCLRFGFEQI